MAIENLKNTLECDYCARNSREVAVLIAGPKGFICAECVTLCMSILSDHYRKSFVPGAPLRFDGNVRVVQGATQ